MSETEKHCCVNLFDCWLIESLHVTLFRYSERKLTDQNSFQQEIQSRLNSGNACCHAEQNIFVSQFAVQKYKNYYVQNYNFTCCFLLV